MLKNKKALAGALVALIVAILFFILVVRPVYNKVEAAIIGGKTISGPLGDFIAELKAMRAPLTLQIPVQLGKGAAVIGFSDNGNDWECYNCYADGLTIKFPRPNIPECNKACICLCEKIKFSQATPKVGGCGDSGQEVPICIDINQDLAPGERTKDILDKTALFMRENPVYWQNGFLFANDVAGANGLSRTEGLMTALMVEKRAEGSIDKIGVCNGEIIFNLNEQLGDSRCIEGYANLEALGLVGDNHPETWKYGGIIVFEDANTDGSTGRSEVILHDVLNFERGSYIDANNKISAVKILGDCIVKLRHNDPTGTLNRVLTGPGEFIASGDFDDENTKMLEFVPPAGRNCLGNSVKVYESGNYNRDDNKGVQLFIDSHPNLNHVVWVHSGGDVEDDIRSVRFAKEHEDWKVSDSFKFRVGLYQNRNYQDPLITLDKSSTSTATGTSSISLISEKRRQAGVILYEHLDFNINDEGRHEVFIASDKSLQTGSFLQHDEASSLKIIGQYRVTLSEHQNFGGKWVEFDNTVDPPTYKVKYNLALNPRTGNVPADSVGRNILEIRDLRNDIYCIKDDNTVIGCSDSDTFNDKLSSIKIELPQAIYNAQIANTCTTTFCQV